MWYLRLSHSMYYKKLIENTLKLEMSAPKIRYKTGFVIYPTPLRVISVQAFITTWKLTCQDKGIQGNPIFHAPKGKMFFLKPTVFRGPCRSKRVRVQVII